MDNTFEERPEYEELYVDGYEVVRVIYDQTHATRITLEEVENIPFVHVDVLKWSPTVGRYLKGMGEQLELQLWLEGYSHIFTYNTDLKFANFMAGREWEFVEKINKGGREVDLYALEIRKPEWA